MRVGGTVLYNWVVIVVLRMGYAVGRDMSLCVIMV